MNRSVLLIVSGLAAVALVAMLVLRRPASETPTTAPVVESASSSTAPVPAAPTSPTTAAPSAPRGVRRVPTPAGETSAPAETAAPESPALDVATLRIDSDVPGAQVFIDRQFVGAAPVTADNIKPGSHQLNVSAEGFEGIAQTIDVTPGPRDITVRFREVRLNARVAVIHKHRLGSCKGDLVATAQGLRYDTADKGDAFMVALADLETFQVDYLEKNLKVKLRTGKQFNFTDPDGNADRLFVFHRDVDKVRARLAKGDTAAVP